MAIIISKNGKDAVKVNKTPFGLEEHIQQYIYENPESIPLYDINDDIKLLILAREFPTQSGPIDALGIDKNGNVYLVETKLYKNPDKRTVIAQVLDYGASLWKHHKDFDSFMLRIDNAVQENFHQTARERIQSFFSLEETEVEELLGSMAENINGGNFKFVVLMDSLHDQLKDLILYMNQNSKFDIYGVEVEYYQHDEFEIIIPKLFGAEVKKDISDRRPSLPAMSEEELREMWIGRVSETSIHSIEDGFMNIAKEVDSEFELKYHKSHLRLTQNGQQNDLFAMVPQKNYLLLFLKIPFSEEINAKGKEANVDLEHRRNEYKLKVEYENISKQREFIKYFIDKFLL